MKCLIDNTEKSFPCSRGCHLFGDCVCEFEKAKQPKMTNYDRIKAMSVQEMTDMLAGYADVSECCYEKFAMCCKEGECQGKDGACRPAIERWLQQEATK